MNFYSDKIINDINDKDLKSIINNKYKSIIKKNDFSVLEDEEDLEKRVKKFFEYLKINFYNKSVLIVTHKGIINKIKDIYLKRTNNDEDFTMGSIEEFEII
jgi:broad specificity phosphatase PhoE